MLKEVIERLLDKIPAERISFPIQERRYVDMYDVRFCSDLFHMKTWREVVFPEEVDYGRLLYLDLKSLELAFPAIVYHSLHSPYEFDFADYFLKGTSIRQKLLAGENASLWSQIIHHYEEFMDSMRAEREW